MISGNGDSSSISYEITIINILLISISYKRQYKQNIVTSQKWTTVGMKYKYKD
jgi:hypothetical protein